MTQSLPAEAQRPTSFPQSRPAVFRTPSRLATNPSLQRNLQSLKVERNEADHQESEDAPPTKRRKVDSPISSDEQEHSNKTRLLANPHKDTLDVSPGLASESDKLRTPGFPEQDLPTGSAPPLPLPIRPWQSKSQVQPTNKDLRTGPRIRQDVRIPTTPCKLEIPDHAPILHDSTVADFFPWVGNHPEDVLNHQTVQSGQFDKPPTSWNESNTARPTLYNTCKHRFGLQTLSALFGSVLQQRIQSQKISSGSAFKPPPRVTLTEAKRKAWLSDLANAAVPLRRLSRTIPQGIRGQSLLDQCLANSVPTSRAIWFAKCVGANEIRTLKRKGTTPTFAASAEAKWSRDWTINIQQFVETVLKDCGKPDWRSHIDYCLRLTTRFYVEDLLDRDTFLDWILDSAKSSGLDQLPFWLMVVHTHSRDLTRSRKRGRYLAELVVEKLGLVQATDAKEFRPLLDRLQSFVKGFVTSRPSCFLMPQKWQQCQPVLRQCLDLSLLSNRKLFEHLCRVNDRASGCKPRTEPQRLSSRQRLIQLLDSTCAPYKLHQIASECDRTTEDKELLVTTTVQWACTPFRYGKAHLYLAIRLLRLWHRAGRDIDRILLAFLANNPSPGGIHAQTLHHLVAELVRSRDFSTSQYLQWIIARGGLRDCFKERKIIFTSTSEGRATEVAIPLCNDPIQLLTEVPLLHLPEHVKSLRSTLLSRAGYATEDEAAALRHCKCFLMQRLGDSSLQPEDLEAGQEYSAPDFNQLPWTLKADIGSLLRAFVARSFKPTSNGPSGRAASEFTYDRFTIVRSVLEEMSDVSMLADTLCHATSSQDESILAAIADTINSHFEALSAIGALDDLHRRISDRYVALKVTRLFLPTLAVSLMDLGNRRPGIWSSTQGLREDMVRGDKGNAVAAYSPFSDGIAESLQQAGTNFVDDFEAVLISEPNMDDHTMKKLFEVVVGRLLKGQPEADAEGSRDDLCLLLARLRICKPSHFDQLMTSWISPMFGSPDESVDCLILALFNVGCLSMDSIHNSFRRLRVEKDPSIGKHCRQSLVRLLSKGVLPDHYRIEPAAYRFRTEWSRYLSSHPVEALAVLSDPNSKTTTSGLNFGSGKTDWVPSLMSSIALQPPEILASFEPETLAALNEALSFLFQIIAGDPAGNVHDLIETCDDFSLPFCRLYLHAIVARAGNDRRSIKDSIVEALLSLAEAEHLSSEGETNSQTKWVAMVSSVDPDIACHMRERAEQAFFALALPSTQNKLGASPLVIHSADMITEASRYVDIVSKTAYTIPETADTSVSAQLNEKLTSVWRGLNVQHPTPTTPLPGLHLNLPQTPTSTTSPPEGVILCSYLPLLLRLICLHRRTSSAQAAITSPTKQSQQDQFKLCMLLVSMALHPALATQPELVSHILDVVATLVDNLSDEVRALCARCLKDKMRDPRVTYLFGSMGADWNGTGSMLQLARQGKGVVGDWKPKQWELVEGSSADTSLNLGLFQCRVGNAKRTHID